MPLKDLEKAEVTCLVDNSVDILLPNTQLAYRPSLGENWFERSLIAEHGFSVVLKLEINGTEHKLLFDSGLSPLAADECRCIGLGLVLLRSSDFKSWPYRPCRWIAQYQKKNEYKGKHTAASPRTCI